MLPLCCLRLACGLCSSLMLLSSTQVNPRFYRVHFLIVLGLSATAAVLLHGSSTAWLWVALASAMLFAFLGSLAWSLESAPGGKMLTALASVSLILALS